MRQIDERTDDEKELYPRTFEFYIETTTDREGPAAKNKGFSYGPVSARIVHEESGAWIEIQVEMGDDGRPKFNITMKKDDVYWMALAPTRIQDTPLYTKQREGHASHPSVYDRGE